MGRLFWKFFFAFWLALLLAGVGVGTAVWLRHKALEESAAPTQQNLDFRATAFVKAAAVVLKYGGVGELKHFLAEETQRIPRVYALNEQDQEILGRDLAPNLLDHVGKLLQQPDYPDAIRVARDASGHRFVLFAVLPEFGFAGGRGLPPHKPPLPILPIIAGTIASILFSFALAWYFAKPIRCLRNAFSAIARGYLNTRVAGLMGKRHDELAELGHRFDDMADKIDQLVKAQQHLLHDVSHELRSPLARMQAAIGLAQQQPEKTQEILQRIERESQRISDLVGELLILSRLAVGGIEEPTPEIDINDMLTDIVADARFEAAVKDVTVDYSGAEDIVLSGRTELLYRAIENVLRNAVKFSHPGSEILVRMDTDDDAKYLRISVDDQGPGVKNEDLAAIFNPFFRGANADNSDGSGLGLTIARRAVEAQGGCISAGNRAGGGLHVEMKLPLNAKKSITSRPSRTGSN